MSGEIPIAKNNEIPISGGLDVAMPKMATVHQRFDDSHINDVERAIHEQITRPEIAARVRSGMRIAIGAGSRGIANIEITVRATVQALKELGAKPFVFPAMGSHGGATAEGQQAVLAGYGITQENVGAPIRATMDTVLIGEMEDGTPVHMDQFAHEADGVVLINRIKPHTSFRGAIESGLVKMMVIGMGKIQGATHMHAHGMDHFPELLPRVAKLIMGRASILFGIGMIENAYDQTTIVEALLSDTLLEREVELQAQAKSLMGRLYFSDIDILLIDRMGKEISGAGFDPNITGRNNRAITGFDVPRVQKIVVLGLTKMTNGNATGLGLADVITRNLYDAIDYASTYANVITSAYLDGALIPIAMPTDQQALQLAVKTLVRVNKGQARIVRIRDTLSIGKISVSEPLLPEAKQHPDMSIIGKLEPFDFAPDGALGPIQ
jgi:hypothetical protein